MKQILLILAILLSTISCSKKKIEYQRLENLKVVSMDSDQITLSADAVFDNPYLLGGTIMPEDITVFIDEEEITKVKSKDFKVPASKNFNVPLLVSVPFNKLSPKGGLLGAVLGNIGKTKKVNFKGVIFYRIAGVKFKYIVNHTEEIKL